MFLPTTKQEIERLGWDRPDVILVTGDSYIDSPFIGTSVIGHVLTHAGYRVAIIAQPDVHSDTDISRLGEPSLFWGVSGGSIDSMIANYTSLKKKRKSDDYTPGGINNRRPDRATIIYTNLIKRYFKSSRPVVLGGLEASLRRIAHYDFWSDRVRGSIVFDAKADYLLYGMAEKSVVQFANALRDGHDVRDIRGLCYVASEADMAKKRAEYLELQPYEKVAEDNNALIDMFHAFYQNSDPVTAKGLYQKHGARYLVHNPPAPYETQEEMDAIYALDYERAQHPYYERQGKVTALETIRFSIPTHRGCYGECNFCAIGVHEGRTVRWRSAESIVAEARLLATNRDFKGYIQDVGGPTANMYGFECGKKLAHGACRDKRCLYPEVCPSLKADHSHHMELLRKIRQVPGVKKVFVASGIRYDLLLSDSQYGRKYLQEVVEHHVSGQMKVAPEHTEESVLRRMQKPGRASLLQFKQTFDEMTKKAGMRQFLTYYLIAAHPGCTLDDMRALKRFASEKLKTNPEQVQIFIPAPSTYSSLMYHTGMDPFTMEPIFVEREQKGREVQKEIIVEKRRLRSKRQDRDR